MIITFPMWIDGRRRLLEDVVIMYPELLEFRWVVREFDGSGAIPGGLHFYEFESIARERGYALEGYELTRFIAGIRDLRDLLMTGTAADGRTANIEFDNVEWTLSFLGPDELLREFATGTLA